MYCLRRKQIWTKFPHSLILHSACGSLLTENKGKNNAMAIKLCAVFVGETKD